MEPYSTNASLLTDRVREALVRYDRDRWEIFVDAMDPGELATDLRLSRDQISRGLWKKEWLFLAGDELFEHDFGTKEGFGPGFSRVHRGAIGGPDAGSCAECHHRGGFDGAGDLTQNAFFDGDGNDPAAGFERNPPAVLGMGIVQRLAEEMTADLQRASEVARANAQASKKTAPVRLESKGIRFGTIVANPDGSLDARNVQGVSADLIVKPFGWKGATATMRDFIIEGFQRHHGIQMARSAAPGPGKEWDRDADGVPNELADGQLDAMTLYLAELEIPVMIPPRDTGLLERHGKGAALFDRIGCSECHTAALPLVDSRLQIAPGLAVDVVAEGESPRPRKDVYSIASSQIFLFSDLKRHRMGEALKDRRPSVDGIPADEFLTRPLWGVADTAPYLHDGRAPNLDLAILMHGGEAQRSAESFARLTAEEKADLRIFLLSLTRYPRIDYR